MRPLANRAAINHVPVISTADTCFKPVVPRLLKAMVPILCLDQQISSGKQQCHGQALLSAEHLRQRKSMAQGLGATRFTQAAALPHVGENTRPHYSDITALAVLPPSRFTTRGVTRQKLRGEGTAKGGPYRGADRHVNILFSPGGAHHL